MCLRFIVRYHPFLFYNLPIATWRRIHILFWFLLSKTRSTVGCGNCLFPKWCLQLPMHGGGSDGETSGNIYFSWSGYPADARSAACCFVTLRRQYTRERICPLNFHTKKRNHSRPMIGCCIPTTMGYSVGGSLSAVRRHDLPKGISLRRGG